MRGPLPGPPRGRADMGLGPGLPLGALSWCDRSRAPAAVDPGHGQGSWGSQDGALAGQDRECWVFTGSPVGSSPLQGLENCLREIPEPRLQPAWPCSSAGDGGPRRAEPRNWAAGMEGNVGRPTSRPEMSQPSGSSLARGSWEAARPIALFSWVEGCGGPGHPAPQCCSESRPELGP